MHSVVVWLRAHPEPGQRDQGVWLLVRDKSHEIKNIKKIMIIIFILYKYSFRGLILSNHVLIINKIH
jgi:hypothetical protein